MNKKVKLIDRMDSLLVEMMEKVRSLNSRSRVSERDELRREQLRRKREEIEDAKILDFLYRPANKSKTLEQRMHNVKPTGISFATLEDQSTAGGVRKKHSMPTDPNTPDWDKSSGFISRQPANRSRATHVSVEIANNQKEVGGYYQENEVPITPKFSIPNDRSEKRKKRLSVLGTRWGLRTFHVCKRLVGERNINVLSPPPNEVITRENYVSVTAPSAEKAASNESELVPVEITENRELVQDMVPVESLISLWQDGDLESGFVSSGESEESINGRVHNHTKSPRYFLKQLCYEILAKSLPRVEVGTSSNRSPGQNIREENLEIDFETGNQNVGTQNRISEPDQVRKMLVGGTCQENETPVVQKLGTLGESRRQARKRLTPRKIKGYKEKAHANKSGCCTVLSNTVGSSPEADKIPPEILGFRVSRRSDLDISGVQFISSEEDSLNKTGPDAESTRRFSDPKSELNVITKAQTSVKVETESSIDQPEPWPPP